MLFLGIAGDFDAKKPKLSAPENLQQDPLKDQQHKPGSDCALTRIAL